MPRPVKKGLLFLISPASITTELKGERKMHYGLAASGFVLDLGSSGGEVLLAVPLLPFLTLCKTLSRPVCFTS